MCSVTSTLINCVKAVSWINFAAYIEFFVFITIVPLRDFLQDSTSPLQQLSIIFFIKNGETLFSVSFSLAWVRVITKNFAPGEGVFKILVLSNIMDGWLFKGSGGPYGRIAPLVVVNCTFFMSFSLNRSCQWDTLYI